MENETKTTKESALSNNQKIVEFHDGVNVYFAKWFHKMVEVAWFTKMVEVV